MVLGFLVKLLWHVLDFPIYSDGPKPGTLHMTDPHHNTKRPARLLDVVEGRSADAVRNWLAART